MADTSRISRRAFTKAAALAGATAAAGIASAQTKPTTKATSTSKPVDRIRIGFIGVGNRGDQNLAANADHHIELIRIEHRDGVAQQVQGAPADAPTNAPAPPSPPAASGIAANSVTFTVMTLSVVLIGVGNGSLVVWANAGTATRIMRATRRVIRM